ncbi:hypothetical protein H5410_005728 [Solanum commersonii]|uniref:Uncharacterized protein n=1 Tax=Solanum commersonii TaxID=4109 RepID=A0A9J6A775_SOLCO|nr:hypothetical protein H5410_005728 [Solanum commersonii]
MLSVIANAFEVERVSIFSDSLSTLAALAITLGMETTFAPFAYVNRKSSLFNLVLMLIRKWKELPFQFGSNVNVGRHSIDNHIYYITLSTLSSLAITLSMETTFAPFVDANGKSSLFNLVLIHSFHFRCIGKNVKHGNHLCPICRCKWKELPFQFDTDVNVGGHRIRKLYPVNFSLSLLIISIPHP